MNNKILKSFLTLLLVVAIAASLGINAFALPISDEIADHYNYNYFGNAVEAPVAYNPIAFVDYKDLGVSDTFNPVDIFVRDEYLYILNKEGNSVVIVDQNYQLVKEVRSLVAAEGQSIPPLNRNILDEEGNLQVDPEMANASPYQFNKPNGIYVTEEHVVYVADTENRRIVAFTVDLSGTGSTATGVVTNVIQGLKSQALGKNFIFKPMKLVVDAAGGVQVISYGVNRGLMQIDDDGTFRQFVGAPKISINAADWFWRQLATEEQKQQLITYEATEYNNIAMDSRTLIYATISTLDPASLKSAIDSKNTATNVKPILRINAAGLDTLRRNAEYPPVGDLDFDEKNSTKVVDVAIAEKGIYTLLDSATSRFFTYDDDGNLLYLGGGSGSQFGRLKSPSSISYWGTDKIVITDTATKSFTVYETTDYAKTVNDAVVANSSGEYELAEQLWEEVLKYNSGLYIAYIGIGKAQMRMANVIYGSESLPHYEKALEYFSLANETTNYSKAAKELQNEKLTQNFTLIFVSLVVLVVGIFVLYFVVKFRNKKKGKRGY